MRNEKQFGFPGTVPHLKKHSVACNGHESDEYLTVEFFYMYLGKNLYELSVEQNLEAFSKHRVKGGQ
jgi:hypothetical protein